jgi:hypothetical protein
MPPVTVFVRMNRDVERANNTPEDLQKRFTEALAAKPAAGAASFPEADAFVGWEGVERPLEEAVTVDGPVVNIRFDWDDQQGADDFLHSKEWLEITGPVTRATFYAVILK